MFLTDSQEKSFWQKYKGYIIEAIIIFLVIAGLYYVYYRITNAEAIAEQAKQLSQEQTQKAATLENELNISRDNAQKLADSIAKISTGQVQPNTTFYVTAPTVPSAAEQVQKRINDYDTTLPAAALEKTDRTVVTPVTKDSSGNILPADQQKVDVYKINLSKDHKIKAGATYVDSHAYWNLGYQQKRFEAIAHMQGENIKGVTGMYTIKEW